jgi:hypothetical protein
MPRRLHYNRFEGKPLPAGAKLVTRPGKWGNPFPVAVQGDPASHAEAVALYRAWIMADDRSGFRGEARRVLAGHDLACTCRIGLPCHADVLLEVANDD